MTSMPRIFLAVFLPLVSGVLAVAAAEEFGLRSLGSGAAIGLAATAATIWILLRDGAIVPEIIRRTALVVAIEWALIAVALLLSIASMKREIADLPPDARRNEGSIAVGLLAAEGLFMGCCALGAVCLLIFLFRRRRSPRTPA